LVDHPEVFVHLGKYGDLMILFPGLQRIYWKTKIKPVVFVSREFSTIFDGITYAVPWIVDLSWWRDVDKARQMAIQLFGRCTTPKFWELKDPAIPPILPGEPTLELVMPNRRFVIAAKDWESFMVSQWEYAGFTRQQMLDWPLVFDKRDNTREEILRRRIFRTSKPKLLVAMPPIGTSVFKQSKFLWPRIKRLHQQFEIVDLSIVRAERIFDLLGLYDRSDFLITTDTATLHLASASTIPYLALVADGGSGSIPKGNCVCSIRYADAIRSIPKIDHLLDSIHDNSRIPNGLLAQRPCDSDPKDHGGAPAKVQGFAHLSA
jgi:hypothetical protein